MTYRHWRLETDSDEIGWLHINHADSPVNMLSLEALDEFAAILTPLERLSLNGLIIISDKKNGFIAGADIKGFQQQTNPAAVEKHIHRVHQLFQRLQKLPFPSLALIHGFCLGGGLELALACTYRIARDDMHTRLGFPEVRLGLFPGYGGSVRAIEHSGPLPVLRLMLHGRSISSRAARQMGLVDQTAPQRQLLATAKSQLKNQPKIRQASLLQRLLNTLPARHLIAPILHRETAKHIKPDHYPAPFALIEHWKQHGGNRAAMFASEATQLGQLVSGETSQNLLRVFFLQERLKSQAGDSDFKPVHVHVVGGGTMGGDIAAWCALKGMRVSLQDRKAENLSNAMGQAHRLYKRKLRNRRLAQAAMDRLMPDPRGNALHKADLVIEAIFEDAAAKQNLFKDLEEKVRPTTLLATNTSSIPLDIISESLRRPQRLIGLHFFNPVARMQLIEIVHGAHTDPDLIAKGAAFARAIDRLPLPVKSSPGFLVNRILMPYLLEAIELVEEGIPPYLIDKAVTEFGMPMGPIELADRVGLDICLAVAEKLAPVFHLEIPQKLRTLVEQNHLGSKSEEGFYHYKQGKMIIQRQTTHHPHPNDLTERMIFRLLNESVACLREGVVEDPDLLDAGVILGTGFAPFRGGPLHYISSGGLEQRRQQLDELEQRYGQQFHADAGWTNLRGI